MTAKKRHSSRKRMESRLRRYHKGAEGFSIVQKIERKSGKVVSESNEPNRPMRQKWAGEKRKAPGRMAREATRKACQIARKKVSRVMNKLARHARAVSRRREKRGWL